MKNNQSLLNLRRSATRLLAFLFLTLLGLGQMWAQAPDVTITASEFGTAKSGVTVNLASSVSVSEQQIWKNGSSAVKANIAQIGNSANADYSVHYVEISSTKEIESVDILAVNNQSSGDWAIPVVYWTGAAAAEFDGYQPITIPCKNATVAPTAQHVDVSAVEGVKTLRIYRTIRINSEGTSFASSKYTTVGDGKTAYIISVAVTFADAGAPVCPLNLTIASQGNKTNFVEGEKISLSASLGAGNGEISYQWYKGGAAISGATSKSYTIDECTLADAGSYTCKATKTDCEDAVSAALVLTVEEYVAPCATMGPITSSVAIDAAPVSGMTLSDASVGSKPVEATNSGLKLGGNDSRLKVTLTDATIVEGTKIVIKYKNPATNSGIGVFNGDYAHQVINLTGVSETGSVEHTFTAEEAANYSDAFIITRNATGASNYINAIEVYSCGTAATKYDYSFSSDKGTAPAAGKDDVVTLPEITGVEGFANIGWTANVAVKVNEETKTAGTQLAIGAQVTLLENTTFTAVWAGKPDAPTFDPASGAELVINTGRINISGVDGGTIYARIGGSYRTKEELLADDGARNKTSVTSSATGPRYLSAIVVKDGIASDVATATYTFIEKFGISAYSGGDADEYAYFSLREGETKMYEMDYTLPASNKNYWVGTTVWEDAFSKNSTFADFTFESGEYLGEGAAVKLVVDASKKTEAASNLGIHAEYTYQIAYSEGSVNWAHVPFALTNAENHEYKTAEVTIPAAYHAGNYEFYVGAKMADGTTFVPGKSHKGTYGEGSQANYKLNEINGLTNSHSVDPHGYFHIYGNSTDRNWYCAFIEHVSYKLLNDDETVFDSAEAYTDDTWTVNIPSTLPTKSGYRCIGWARTKGATTADIAAGGEYNFWKYEDTFYPVWEEAFAQSINIEQFVIDNGKSGDIKAALTAANFNYQLESDDVLDDLVADESKNDKNCAFRGLKMKHNGSYVAGSITAGKLVDVVIGNLGSAKVQINEVDATPALVAGIGTTNKTTPDNYKNSHNYYYCETAAVLKVLSTGSSTTVLKGINIIDPFVVTFANGGEIDPMTFKGTALVLPAATGEGEFQGWFDAETAGNKIGDAGASYTPSTSITLYAQFSTQSTDATLANLTVNGEQIAGFEADKQVYNIELPYKSGLPTVVATKNSDVASISNVTEVTELPGTYSFTVTAEAGNTLDYQVRFTVAPKDGICLIHAEFTGNGAISVKNELSAIGGTVTPTGSLNSATTYGGKTGYKFQTDNKVALTLAEGSFLAGDIVEVFVTTAQAKPILAYSDATGETEIARGAANMVQGVNRVTLTAGASTLYFIRNSANGWNPNVAYFAVYRATNPVLTALTIGGETAEINEENKTVTVALHNLDDVTLNPTIVSNTPALTEGVLSGDAWEFDTPRTYTLTDKDGDATVYSITITQVAPFEMDVTAGKYGTICMPYAVAADARSGAVFYNIESKNAAGNGIIIAEEEGALVAGKPYIYYAEEEVTMTLTFSGAKATEVVAANGLVGYLEATENVEVTSNTYFLKNNTLFHYTGENTTVTAPANKAFISWTAVPDYVAPVVEAPRRVIYMENVTDTATGLDNLNAAEQVKFIQNGVLYIRVADRLFDATGRLVK